MKLLLEIKDNQAPFILDLLSRFSYVKIKTISPEKNRVISNLEKGIEEVNQAKEGKIKLKSVRDLLNDL